MASSRTHSIYWRTTPLIVLTLSLLTGTPSSGNASIVGAQPYTLRWQEGMRQVFSLAFSPDGRTLASGVRWRLAKITTADSNFSEVLLWDVPSRKVIKTFRHSQGRRAVYVLTAFSPDGKTLATAIDDKYAKSEAQLSADNYTIKLWDVRSGRIKRSLKTPQERVHQVAFSPDGSTLAAATTDRTSSKRAPRQIRLWKVSNGKLTGSLTQSKDSVAFSPNGSVIASGLKWWDARTGKFKRELVGHARWVGAVAFSRDGELFASGSGDHTVKLWDAKAGRLLRTLDKAPSSVHSIALSPDSRLLIGAGAGGVVRRDRTVRFADGRTIRLLAREDRGNEETMWLWDTRTGKVLQSFNAHTWGINDAVFSPDGKMIASASDDGTVKLWTLS